MLILCGWYVYCDTHEIAGHLSAVPSQDNQPFCQIKSDLMPIICSLFLYAGFSSQIEALIFNITV